MKKGEGSMGKAPSPPTRLYTPLGGGLNQKRMNGGVKKPI